MDLEKVKKDGRMKRALIGLSAEVFRELGPKFGELLRQQRAQRPGGKTAVGTERPIQRPKKPGRNRRHDSGKKKSHQRKQVVVSDEPKRILILTVAKPGRGHDKNLSDRAHLTQPLPPEVGVLGDTAFTGNKHPNLQIPQKGRKNQPLSEAQRAGNQWVSRARVVVEHAIGGMKRFGVMSQKLRNKIGRFDDQVALVCAGLWNLQLAHVA